MPNTKKFSWGGTANAAQTTATGASNPVNLPHLNKIVQVNCLAGSANVNVLGSIDGGVTFPFVLASLILATATTASAGFSGTGGYDTVALNVTSATGATVNGWARSARSKI